MLSSYDIETPYVDEIASQFHFDRRIKVVLDSGNGAGGDALHRLFAKLNCDVTELFFEMGWPFPEPSSGSDGSGEFEPHVRQSPGDRG